MRRIYESGALEYDDEDPHAPKRNDGDDPGPRSIDWEAASHALLPGRLRAWAVDVDVETDRDVYAPDDPIRFEVRLANRIPFPVTLRTDSPVPWTWSVDGLDEASHVTDHPERSDLLRFGRRERKVFRRNWYQRVRRSEREWEVADRGDHTLGVRVTVPDAEGMGLSAETSFRVE